MNPDIDKLYKNKGRRIVPVDNISGIVKWQSPSNIALIKYWGKHGLQLPSNPSISFTLTDSYTETEIQYISKENEGIDFTFSLDGIVNNSFNSKLNNFFQNIESYFPFLNNLKLNIISSNTFPHSSGIASSASGMSALALCLCTIEKRLFDSFENDDEFYQKASFIARLGSGSAARSIYGGIVSWGKNDLFNNSSDLFASQINENIHSDFKTYKNSILVINPGEKKVSSSLGHSLMKNHSFAASRFEQAKKNYHGIIEVLKTGDVEKFITIVENEAMSLHAMMMTSRPWYMLMSPESIRVLMKIKEFRKETKIPVGFTMDAGPNIHLLYPEKYTNLIQNFINSEISTDIIIHNIIFDSIGTGPKELKLL